MAKVKIQGHASGTGILTVTAPNTSTDRTITLPDEDVTLGAATPSIDDNGNATAMTIDSSENVLVGQTTSNFDAKGIRMRGDVGQITATRDGAAPLALNRLTSDGSVLDFNKAGNGVGSIGVTSSGAYITLGGTAADNALNDYEEGVHQLSITGSTGGSMTMKSGYEYLAYTKIGRLVTVQGRWETTAKNSATGVMTFSLPFTAGSFNGQSAVSSGVFSLYRANANFNNVRINVFSSANTATIWYNQGGTGDSDDRVEMQNIDGTVEGYMCLTYMTA